MKTMDHDKAIQAMEKFTLHKYLEKLINSSMHKVTLFPAFPKTGAPNLSDPAYFILIDDLSKIVSINSGSYLN
ncbi:hypothetical protein AMJ44_07215 [candidate division WOR-1 bacterium DG_54_3]|uniref:Uncharacterized protein n=1 Tax=candidate division WOR-1 bacterium DG_54_3 TaxID=1703775 RepID=A0A0S7XYQ3_UNCSA|nr:MAG: hypothetical protein AMJ44_07215 [candidate division WOR-1 bacterium DG_54_3]